MFSMFHPFLAIVATTKEPMISTNDRPDNIGKMISCLLAFKILKLLMVSFQPFSKRSKKLIVSKVLVKNIKIKILWYQEKNFYGTVSNTYQVWKFVKIYF